jgi:hypothetical protein
MDVEERREMAWIDDRIWCHPKFTELSKSAFGVYCKGLAYSSGMTTGGLLTQGQQKILDATAKDRRELIEAGLWDEIDGSTSVRIHDWDDHNGRRDERRRKDRERKRQLRTTT